MNISADRMAAAYFDAIEVLVGVTPKGWYAERGAERAALSYSGIATLNCAYATTREPDLGALDELAGEVGRAGVPWSIMVRAADDAVAALAARHGLGARHEMPLLACAAGEVVFRSGEAARDAVREVGTAESDRYTQALTAGFEAPEGAFGSLMGGGVLDAAPITGYLADASGTGLGIQTRGVVGVYNVCVAGAALASAEGEFARAARMVGVADAAFAALGQVPDPDDAAELAAVRDRAGEALGAAGFTAEYDRGRLLDPRAAFD